MELPFKLNKYHKIITKYDWEQIGLIFNDDEFEAIYKKYITSSQCELCSKTFTKAKDRRLKISSKNVICSSCFNEIKFIHRDDLPFELRKNHKSKTKSNWKTYSGLIFNDNEFEAIYERYITSSKCELCSKTFLTTSDRHMEHDHTTGKFRNVVCTKCNQLKSDRKISINNKSGYTGIRKSIGKKYKQGFIWSFSVSIDGKVKKIKSSIDLDWLIKYADNWKLENNYHT